MRCRCFAAMLLPGLMVLATSVHAQDPGLRRFPARFVPVALDASAVPSIPADLSPASRDLRWHGTVIGAVGLGIAGGLTGAAYCGNSENGSRDCTGTTVLWSAAGAAIGGVAGHFLGRLIPR